MVARIQEREERRMKRGHAACEDRRGLSSLVARELLLESDLVGAGFPAVDQEVRVGRIDVVRIARKPVGVRGDDGRADGSGGSVGAVSPVHGPGGVVHRGGVVAVGSACHGFSIVRIPERAADA